MMNLDQSYYRRNGRDLCDVHDFRLGRLIATVVGTPQRRRRLCTCHFMEFHCNFAFGSGAICVLVGVCS